MNYRLLQIFNVYLKRGGEEASVNRIYKILSRDNHVERCIFYSQNWKGPSAPPIWKQPFLMIHNPEALNSIKRKHEEFKPHAWIVHNVFPVASIGVYKLAKQLNVPIIQFLHNYRFFSPGAILIANGEKCEAGLKKNFLPEIWSGTWQNSRLKTLWMSIILLRLHYSGWLHSIKAWIAISDSMRRIFLKTGLPGKKVFTLKHCWILNKQQGKTSTDDYFLFLGRLRWEKGIMTLLECWEILHKKLGDKSPRLIICGSGPFHLEVARHTEKNKNIEFRGMVFGKDKENLIRHCCAVISPALWPEPLGLTTYEAYDFSKPVLASNMGAFPETVMNNITGFLHEPGNAIELSEQVLKLYASPALAAEMGRKGRRWLEENTNCEKWLKSFYCILSKALGPL